MPARAPLHDPVHPRAVIHRSRCTRLPWKEAPMIDAETINRLGGYLGNRAIAINAKEIVDGDVIAEEFFLKRVQGEFCIGHDRYDIKYEDSTVLYEAHVRVKFPDLKSAMEFINSNFPTKMDQVLSHVLGRRKGRN